MPYGWYPISTALWHSAPAPASPSTHPALLLRALLVCRWWWKRPPDACCFLRGLCGRLFSSSCPPPDRSGRGRWVGWWVGGVTGCNWDAPPHTIQSASLQQLSPIQSSSWPELPSHNTTILDDSVMICCQTTGIVLS